MEHKIKLTLRISIEWRNKPSFGRKKKGKEKGGEKRGNI